MGCCFSIQRENKSTNTDYRKSLREKLEERGEVTQANLEDKFMESDTSGNGTLNGPEIWKLFTDMGEDVPEDDIRKLMMQMDKNYNLKIGYAEFSAWFFK